MKIENKEEREYYLRESAEQNWSFRVLERNIFASKYKTVLPTEEELADMIATENSRLLADK